VLKKNTFKKSFFLIISSLVVLFVVNVPTYSQTPSSLPGPTPGVTTANGGDGSPEVPFDGGMGLLLAASGISYAVKQRIKK
jgi:hypothetical protein